MVKMNTTLKHKKKNNVKKNSNKNKSNKNKKTTRQKKYYRKRKYSRKMKGGKVCIKSTRQCLTVVGKYGDASSANKPTTKIIDENKNVLTLTPVALTPVDSQIVDDGAGSGVIVKNSSVENVNDLSDINLDLDNDVVDSVNAGLENVDEGNEENLGQGIQDTSSGTVVSDVVDSVDVDKIEEDITSPPAEVSDVEKVEDGTGSGNEVSDIVVDTENAGEGIQANVDLTQDNMNPPLVDSSVVNEVQGNISPRDDTDSASGVSDVVSVENKEKEQLNPLPPNRPPPPPKGSAPLPPQPPIKQAQGNNVSTDNNNTEIDSIGNNVPLNLSEDGSQKLSGSSESMDNQNTQRSDDSITNNENNKTKPIIDNWMKKSEKHVYDNKGEVLKQLLEKTPKSSPEKEVLLRSRSSPNILPQNENNDDNYILTSRSEKTTPIDSQQTTPKEDNFSKYQGAKKLLDQAISLNESRNKQNLNRESESSKTNNDDWDKQGGKTRRRRSIKKNKKNSKSKKQSKKMRKNKKTRK
jgi:hypothetical protein